MPQLRIWAHMIDSGNYSNRHTPPKHPAFDGTEPKRPKKQSLSEAIVEAANCFSKHVHTTDIHQSGGPNSVLLTRQPARETRASSDFSTGVGILQVKLLNYGSRNFRSLGSFNSYWSTMSLLRKNLQSKNLWYSAPCANSLTE